MTESTQEPAWLHGHAHEPNPSPPSDDAALLLRFPDGSSQRLTVAELMQLPHTEVGECYIVSTGHGTSGPFRFGGVTLHDLLAAYVPDDVAWRLADVVSGDGFGNRIQRSETPALSRPILLAYAIDGRPLTRAAGLVRLIVPSETDDALRQVKWIAEIRLI